MSGARLRRAIPPGLKRDYRREQRVNWQRYVRSTLSRLKRSGLGLLGNAWFQGMVTGLVTGFISGVILPMLLN